MIKITDKYLQTELSKFIWEDKYKYRDIDKEYEHCIEDTWQRVAIGLAKAEKHEQKHWQEKFYNILENFKFIPGGRILAGTNTHHKVTLFNCFVMGTIEDSLDSIFDNLKEAALTMQQGGGVGYDFSTLRPSGLPAITTGAIASGPVSFMHVWDRMCETIVSTGSRRGAMMATLRCDHPDIMEFVSAKETGIVLKHFNLSVLVTDEFINAIKNNNDWELIFPCADKESYSENDANIVFRRWSGESNYVPCRILSVIKARTLWNKIMRSTYDYAEPGVLFVDRINQLNNLWYQENISATNPCGEIPLPAYGACDLGSINLTKFIKYPFTKNAELDMSGINETATIATRLLDNVIDISNFPLNKQKQQAHQSRRVGLGFTGLADALIMLGIHYGDKLACNKAQSIMESITHTAYQTSIELAKEKSRFLSFNKDKYLQSPFIQSLPDSIISEINKYGIRNSHLTAIAHYRND